MSTLSNLNSPRRLPITLLIALPLLVAVGLAGWLFAGRSGKAMPAPAAAYAMPINPAIEAKWGVRISQVALTAAGGLVDLRYTVLDTDKAHAMLDSLATTPKVEAPEGVTIAQEGAKHHKNELEAGRSYFLIFVNRKGALKVGDKATVTIGDLRLENVPVR